MARSALAGVAAPGTHLSPHARTVPGGKTGDGSRFANGSRLASYAGLAPVTRQSGKSLNGESGDRMLIACEGGASRSRLELFPPRLEIEERDGTYVLVDDGPREQWRYVFMPRRP